MIDKIVRVIFQQGSEGGDKARADIKATYEAANQAAQAEVTNQAKIKESVENLTVALRMAKENKKAAFDPAAIKDADASIKATTENLKIMQTQLRENSGAMGHFRNQLNQGIESFKQGLKNALMGGGIAFLTYEAVAGVKKFVKESIQAFAQLESSEERLGYAMNNIAKEGQNMTDRLIKQANELQKITGFARQEIIEGQTSLITKFGLSATQTEKAMSRIIDLAAATNRPISNIVQALGSGMEGRLQTLKTLGIEIKKGSDATQVFDQFMQETKKDLGEAAANMDTLSGQIRKYESEILEAKQDTGSWLDELGKGIESTIEDLETMLGLQSLQTRQDQDQLEHLKEVMKARKGELDAALDIFDKETKAQKIAEIQARTTALEIGKTRKIQAQVEYDKLIALKDQEPINIIHNSENDKRSPYYHINQRIQQQQDKVQGIKDEIYYEGELLKQMKLINEGRAPSENDTTGKVLPDYTEKIEAIKKERADKAAQDAVDAIKDETAKKIAEQDLSFQKEKEQIIQQQRELEKIISKPGSTPQDEINKAKALASKKEVDLLLEKLEHDHQQAVYNIIKTADDELLKQKQEDDKKVLERQKEDDKLRIEEQKSLNDKLYSDEQKSLSQQYEMEMEQLRKAHDNKDITDEQYKLKQDQAKVDENARKVNLDKAFGKSTIDDQIALDNSLDQLAEDREAERKKEYKNIIEWLQSITDAMFEAINEQNELQQKANNYRIGQQDSMIEEQKVLAQAGLKNELAFEEKRRNDLAAQQIKLVQKQKKAKELETFINAIAKYSETDPKTAIPKAAMLLAAMKVGEAVYAEKGGLLGDIKDTSLIGPWGASKHHASGRDILVHAEEGEGMLSRNDISNLGGREGFYKLKDMLKSPLPLTEIPLKNSVIIAAQKNEELVTELRSVKKAIENKAEFIFDFEGMNAMIETRIEKGITSRIKHINSPKRI